MPMSKYNNPLFLRYLGNDDFTSKYVYSYHERLEIQRYRTIRNRVYRYKLKVLAQLLKQY